MRRIRLGEDELQGMNKRRFQRAVLLTGFIGLLLVGGYGLWLFQTQRHQYALNRQLIAALRQGNHQQALVLVKSGADPNTPERPIPPPTIRQLWNHLFHRSPLPTNDSPTAFLIACGESWTIDEDDPQLVQTMLQHGAQKNAMSGGWTPLIRSVFADRSKTVEVLLQSGVDVNAQERNGYTALVYSLMLGSTRQPSDYSRDANIVHQLLSHGANRNLPDRYGVTPLQEAQQCNRPDLLALLKQDGAKK